MALFKFASFGALRSILFLGLELLAGLLISITAILLLGWWWLQTPENQQWLEQTLRSQLDKHLPNNHRVDFREVQMAIDPVDINLRITFGKGQYTSIDHQIDFRKMALSFRLIDLFKRDYMPESIEFDKLTQASLSSQTSPGLIAELLGLSQQFQGIERFSVAAFSANISQHTPWSSITGRLDLMSSDNPQLHFDGLVHHHDPTHPPLPLDTTLKLPASGAEVSASLIPPTQTLSLIESPSGATDWLQTLGDRGTLKATLFVPETAFSAIASAPAPLDAVAKHAEYQVNLAWPQISPVLNVNLQRAAGQSVKLVAKTLAPLPAPKILPKATTVQQAHVTASSSESFQRWTDITVDATLNSQTNIRTEGQHNFATATGAFTFRVTNLDHSWLADVFPPGTLTLKQGLIREGEGRLHIDNHTAALERFSGDATNLILTVKGETVKVPALGFAYRPDALRVFSTSTIGYQDMTIEALSLDGAPAGRMRGTATIAIAPSQARSRFLSFLPTRWSNLDITTSRPVPLQVTFTLDIDQGTFTPKEARSTAPIDVVFEGTPATIAEVQIGGQTSIAFKGTVLGEPFAFRENPDEYHFSIARLPMTILNRLANLEDYIAESEGTVGLALTYDRRRDRLFANLDAKATGFSLKDLNYQKPVGASATLKLDASKTRHDLWQAKITTDVPLLRGPVDLKFDSGRSRLTSLESHNLWFQDVRHSVRLNREEGGYRLSLSSGKLRFTRAVLSDLLDSWLFQGAALMPPLHDLHWRFREGFSVEGNDLGTGHAILTFSSNPERFGFAFTDYDALEISFNEPSPVQLNDTVRSTKILAVHQHSVNYQRGERLMIQSNNFGKVLRILGLTRVVDGGVLYSSLNHQSGDQVISGAFDLKQYTVTETSAMTGVLQAVSLTGLLPLLSNSGLSFDSLSTTLTLDDSQWKFDNLSTFGASLSVTFDGVIDLKRDTIVGSGTVSPTSVLNEIIGKIPVVNVMLTGAKGGGLIASNYTVEGSLSEPEVSSNPISLLSPGVLRNIFKEIFN